jgi:hypothetical protein
LTTVLCKRQTQVELQGIILCATQCAFLPRAQSTPFKAPLILEFVHDPDALLRDETSRHHIISTCQRKTTSHLIIIRWLQHQTTYTLVKYIHLIFILRSAGLPDARRKTALNILEICLRNKLLMHFPSDSTFI